MARISGINIPDQKHLGIALTYIFGIGRARALVICKAAGLDPARKVRDYGEDETERGRARTPAGPLRHGDPLFLQQTGTRKPADPARKGSTYIV